MVAKKINIGPFNGQLKAAILSLGKPEKPLSQQDISDALKVSKSVVSEYVRGVKKVSPGFIKKFENFYKVSVSSFEPVVDILNVDDVTQNSSIKTSFKDKYFKLLEETNSTLKEQIVSIKKDLYSPEEMKEDLSILRAYMKTILDCQGRIRAKMENVSEDEARSEIDKVLIERVQKAQEKDTNGL